MERDAADHVRFCPVQSALGQKLLAKYGAPNDLSTAVRIAVYSTQVGFQRLGISSSNFFSAFRNLSRLLQLMAW